MHGVEDTLTVTVSGTAYSSPGDNLFPDLNTQWQRDEVQYLWRWRRQPGSLQQRIDAVVRVGVDNGTTAPPDCDDVSFTGETNNLTLVNSPPTALPGTLPALVFSESFPAAPGAPATCADATSIGDTHLTTFDGLYYDFQASGEFLLAQDGPEFVVQTRQASGAPTWPNAAVNKAVAVRMGRTRVALYIEPTRLIVDGTANNLADGKTVLLPSGVQISRSGNLYVIWSESGNVVRATLNSTWIDVTVGLGHAPTDSRGLLGNSRGNAQVLGDVPTEWC